MKQVTQNFKNNIKKYGRQLNATITTNNEVIDAENINNINHSFNTGLFKTVMNVLEIDSNVKIERNKLVSASVGVKFEDSEYEYIEYNNYKVIDEPEKQEDTLSYKILAYDKMIESMVDYDLEVTGKITLRDYLIRICNRLGWNTNNIPATFINSSKLVSPALHQGIGYTFRDALDEIATISCSFLFFIGNNFYLKYITETSEIIDEESLSENDVSIGEEYFINSLVFARAEESDNIYRKDDTSIEENGLHEYRVSDNQLLSTNNRDEYIDEMFSYLITFRFFTYDVKSTGIMFLDIADRFSFYVHEQTYSTIMLNDEVNVTQGLEERLYVDKPEESETDYKCADTTDRRINQTYLLVDKQNQSIESMISTVDSQNTQISSIQQTVGELNSKISNIADITMSQESVRGNLTFERVNQSEPIRIELYPINESITCLHPRDNLYPANDLYMQLRTLRFTNTTTNEVWDYELPDDLLIYDENNYDTFVMDYDSQTCYINKKCAYDNQGNIILLSTPRTEEFEFTHIELTDGDYTVKILKHESTAYIAYLKVSLMAQNIYTTQFATKAEVNSEISQTATQIDLSVNQKLTNYSTTAQMNSAISLKANEITSSVSNTYATKANVSTQISTLTQTATRLESKIENSESDISTINQSIDKIEIEVGNKYNTSDFTNAKIVAKINDGTSSAQISASKISLSGKIIELTSDNIKINSNNFKVDNNGNLTCSNATISGKITSSSGTIGGFTIGANSISAEGSGCKVFLDNASNDNKDFLVVRTGSAGNYSYPFYVRGDGTLYANNATISGIINATTGTFRNCTITDSCQVPASTISGTLKTNNIPNLSASKITSGTMSADRISGGTISGIDINAGTIYGSSVHGSNSISGGLIVSVDNAFGHFEIGGDTGEDAEIPVPISITVVDGRVTAQTWKRLVFHGGILVEVQDSW